jgi:hypothetical protein
MSTYNGTVKYIHWCGAKKDAALTPLAKAIMLEMILPDIDILKQRQMTIAQAEGRQPMNVKRKL